MRSLPSITIQTNTLNNNIPVFRRVLESVKKQDYPHDKIEHIVFDKESTNGCDRLAKKYGCTVYRRSDPVGQEEVQTVGGFLIAKGELILILEADNILIGSDWLLKMVKPFVKEKKIVAAFSAYNTFEKGMSITTRYAALFGTPDPTAYYLKKSEKIRMDQKEYDKGIRIKETGDYYIVRFTKETLPAIGDNGHMFLRRAIRQVLDKPEDYTHTDAFARLLTKGYDTYGVVKNSIIHVARPDIVGFVKRRVQVKKFYYDGRRGRRAYLTYDPSSAKDRRNLMKYIFFSFTFIEPFYESMRGFIKIRDNAWFLHPVMCFFMVIAYGISEIEFYIKNLFRKILEFLKQKNSSWKVQIISPYLEDREHILDFGCGDLLFSQVLLKQLPRLKITGVDIIDVSIHPENMRFVLYEGKILPFADNSFDTVICIYTLHHCENAEKSLKECLRVAKKRVLIIESIPRTAIEKRIMKFIDWIVNAWKPTPIPLSYQFLTEKDWNRLSHKYQAKVIIRTIHHDLLLLVTVGKQSLIEISKR